MTRSINVLFIILIAFLFSGTTRLGATHIIGGDMTYRCLGGGKFEVTLTFTRDCELGAADAEFDNYAIVAIYDHNFNPVSIGTAGYMFMPYIEDDTLRTDLTSFCDISGAEVCVHQTVFRDTITLLPRTGGYIFSYQRCCRNASLLNVKDPLQTGSTITIALTEEAFNACNSSPVFNQWPDIYVCTNRPINVSQLATDPDGDQLVYKLNTPFSGATIQEPRPDRFGKFTLPYKPLEWAPGYTLNNLLGSAAPLQINPANGFITGIPDHPGQFAVGIMVEEYRNGKLLSVVKRDFQFNVRSCGTPPVADFEAPTVLCGSDDFTVNFINTSQDADQYFWRFNYPSIAPEETSTEVNPVYTYPGIAEFSGKQVFTVGLKAVRTLDQCYDEIFKDILAINDELLTDFTFEILSCEDDALQIVLKDISETLNTAYSINGRKWTVKISDTDIRTSNEKEFFLTIPKQATIDVTLEITTVENCEAEIHKTLNVDYVDIQFTGNPIEVCSGEIIEQLVANPNSSWSYTWSPEEGLIFGSETDKSNPKCLIDHDITYSVTVTDGVCTVEGSVTVIVNDWFTLSIDGPESVCGQEVTLTAIGTDDPDVIYEWSLEADYTPIIATGKTVTLSFEEKEQLFYLRIKEGTGCALNDTSILVRSNNIELEFEKAVTFCAGLEKEVTLVNLRPDQNLTINWQDNPNISIENNGYTVLISSDINQEFYIYFSAINQFGCDTEDSIYVSVLAAPFLGIEEVFECDTYTYCFSAFNGEGTDYQWNFGDAQSPVNTSTLASPCHGYPGPGKYTVTVSAFFEVCESNFEVSEEVVVPENFELEALDTVVFCKGDDSVMLDVTPTNFTMDVKWYNEQDQLIGTGIMVDYSPEGDELLHIVAVDTFGCTAEKYMFLDEYTFDLSKDNPGVLCFGDTVTLKVYNNTSDILEYLWESDPAIISPLNRDSIVVVLSTSGDFVVTVTNPEYGCVSDPIIISVLVNHVTAAIEADTTTIVVTKSTTLRVNGNFDQNAKILWSTGETTQTITVSPGETTTYCVTVTDEEGCTAEDCLEIVVLDPACDETDIFIPNAFSPHDNNNVNDIFRPRGKYLETVEIIIYDRWGKQLFEGKGDPDTNWDGTHKGTYLGPDAYVFVVKVVCQNQKIYEKAGNVTIIR